LPKTALKVVVSVIVGMTVLVVVNFIAVRTIGIGVIVIRRLDLPTQLVDAVQRRNEDHVRRLIIAGADVNEQRGRSLALGACFLVNCHTSARRYGDTALMAAVEAQSPGIVRRLLDSGADAALRDSAGDDALDLAARHVTSEEQKAVFLMLFEHNGGRLRDSATRDVIVSAARAGDIEFVRRFLPQVTDASTLERAMCFAVRTPAYEVIDVLHERLGGWPMNLYTCLPTYSEDAIPVLQYLIEHGFDLNERSAPYRMTLLASRVPNLPAIVYQNCSCKLLPDVQIIQLLLQHGADPRAGEETGNSALQLARAQNKTTFVQWFETGKLTVVPDPNGLSNCGEPPPPCADSSAAELLLQLFEFRA
jgi:hypothetical protein